ncbi:MAG: hypothetical protein A2X23_05250 [Chloroflexi bacterium GWC2_73_18]|nr:MAG: hypothetical protein A2X23_05250 [Chloroflexi bacterium GWC2_73_18]
MSRSTELAEPQVSPGTGGTLRPPGSRAAVAVAGGRFGYPELRNELRAEALRRVFVRGQGGPLIFLWILGTGVLLTLLNAPFLALLYSVGIALFTLPIVRDALVDPEAQRALLREALARRFPLDGVADLDLRAELERGIVALTEMALKIHAGGRQSAAAGLHSIFADAAELLDLQLESARQADELERILRFVGERQPRRAAAEGRRRGTDDDDVTALWHQNVEAVRGEAVSARELVADLTQKLETMLLQAFQMDREAIDLVRVAEAERESSASITRLQDVVNARRKAASRLIAVLGPEAGAYVRDQV